MMSTPLVSVIVACYNKSAHILETIASVIDQSYTVWELLIVDDHSTDGSADLAGSVNDSRITVMTNDTNRGANFCRNLGIQASKGEYVMFLDADDLLAPHCLEARINAAIRHPGVGLLVFSMGVFYRAPGDDSREWQPVSKAPLDDFLQHQLPWSIMQPFWKKEFLLRTGGFDESFQRLQDVELHTRTLLYQDVGVIQVPGPPNCFYRIDEGRKNYAPEIFFRRWITAAAQYCDKFYPLVPADKKKLLLGTVYKTYTALLFARRGHQLSPEEFKDLESRLLKKTLVMKPPCWKCRSSRISSR